MKRGFRLESDYYEYAMRGFDLLAPQYDEEIGSNAIGMKMRRALREMLIETFREGDQVFEVGCGTGLDTIFLANRGIHVVATDISREMLAQLHAKVAAQGLSGKITLRRLPAHQIGKLAEEWGSDSFDGGFCHAGALNMEPNVALVPEQLHTLIKHQGHFVCSVANKLSLFESFFYTVVLKPRKAFRRLDNIVPLPISTSPQFRRYVIPSLFLSPGELKRLFAEFFALDEMVGLQVFSPPHNLDEVYRRFRPFFFPLDMLEKVLAHRFPANRLGHYTLARFRHVGTKGKSL